MRTLAITQNTTIDGRVEMLGDWFLDQEQAADADLLAENRRQREAADALLLGRRSFTDMRGYWRDLVDDATGISAYLNGVRKHVVSTTLDDPEWDGTTLLDPSAGDLVDQVRGLKAGSDGGTADIVVTGSISLCHALVAADLVDEYRLFTYPVVQGAGRGLFPDGWESRDLRPRDQRTFPSGVVLQVWARG